MKAKQKWRLGLVAWVLGGAVASAVMAQGMPVHPKSREFIDAYLKVLPDADPNQAEFARSCQKVGPECPLMEVIGYADTACNLFKEGKTREEIVESTGKFFEREELDVIIDAGILSICPEQKKWLRK